MQNLGGVNDYGMFGMHYKQLCIQDMLVIVEYLGCASDCEIFGMGY